MRIPFLPSVPKIFSYRVFVERTGAVIILAEFKSHRERRYCPHSQHVEGGINFEIEEHEEVLLGGSVEDTFGASSGSSYYGDKKILVNTQAALVQTKRI